MDNKTLFCSFYVSFCTFYASLRLTRTCLPHEIAQRYLFGVISASKNLFTPLETCFCFLMGCNLRLINDLRSTKVYVRKNNLFMQNKANFRKSQMNVSTILTKDYENKTLGEHEKKQSQTKPNKAKFKKAKMNVTSIITKGYENISPIRAPKKQSQISKRQKSMQTSLPQRIMKKTAFSGPGKTNPNEPNACPPSVWRVKLSLLSVSSFCFSLFCAPAIICPCKIGLYNAS